MLHFHGILAIVVEPPAHIGGLVCREGGAGQHPRGVQKTHLPHKGKERVFIGIAAVQTKHDEIRAIDVVRPGYGIECHVRVKWWSMDHSIRSPATRDKTTLCDGMRQGFFFGNVIPLELRCPILRLHECTARKFA